MSWLFRYLSLIYSLIKLKKRPNANGWSLHSVSFCVFYILSWMVREITSSSCSLLSLLKLTANPLIRIVSGGYFSGWFCALRSISRLNTFTLRWYPQEWTYPSVIVARFSTRSSSVVPSEGALRWTCWKFCRLFFWIIKNGKEGLPQPWDNVFI